MKKIYLIKYINIDLIKNERYLLKYKGLGNYFL